MVVLVASIVAYAMIVVVANGCTGFSSFLQYYMVVSVVSTATFTK